jgi:sulfate/thiosulfate-binding protein
MRQRRALNLFGLSLAALAIGALAVRNLSAAAPISLLNASYDPTRELYAQLNPLFIKQYQGSTGERVEIKQSHAGSSRQARAVIDGEHAADVVTFGLPSDVDVLRKRGLVGDKWSERLPNQSRPYTSTIVFVVRSGNPLNVHDWPDLLQPNVEIITPDPRSSGNAKLSALAAWGAVLLRGGSEADAKAYLKRFYEHAPFLEPAARGAALAFAVENLGDVHLAWENEALREVSESKGALELVYPPLSIVAEPSVTWVDSNVGKHHTEALAKAYLEFLFTEPAQEIIAQSGYRPFNASVLARHSKSFPDLKLFSITAIAKDWEDAQQRFFAENGIIDTVYEPKPR